MMLHNFFPGVYKLYKGVETNLQIDVDNHGQACHLEIDGEGYDNSVQTYSALYYLDLQAHIKH